MLRPGQSTPTDRQAVALCIPLFHDQQEELLCAMLLAATSQQPAHAMYEAWNNWGPGHLPSLGALVITSERPSPADTLLVAFNAMLLGAAVGRAVLPKALQGVTALARDAGIHGDYVPGRGMATHGPLAVTRSTVADVPAQCSRRSRCSDGDHEPPEDPAMPSGSTGVDGAAKPKQRHVLQDVATLVYQDPLLEELYMQQRVGRAVHVRHGIVVACFVLATLGLCRAGHWSSLAMLLPATISMVAATTATLRGQWYADQHVPRGCCSPDTGACASAAS